MSARHAATRIALAVALGLGATAVHAQVAVIDAWVRGTVAGQQATGAYMQLKSATDTALVAAASPVAGVVEIHEMKMDGGVMKMSAIKRLAVPAGKATELKPGGYHVMLMELKQPLKRRRDGTGDADLRGHGGKEADRGGEGAGEAARGPATGHGAQALNAGTRQTRPATRSAGVPAGAGAPRVGGVGSTELGRRAFAAGQSGAACTGSGGASRRPSEETKNGAQ